MNTAAITVTAGKRSVQLTEEKLFEFYETIDRNGPQPDRSVPAYAKLDRCWTWEGLLDRKGYGHSGSFRAHRLSWSLHNGQIPPKIFVCHKCDNPSCVNPDHLFLGTNYDNVRDKEDKGRGNQPSGDKHGSKTKPDTVPRGDRHGRKTKPHRNARGERNGKAKLTEDNVREILACDGSSEERKKLALKFSITRNVVNKIFRGELWKHVSREQ